MMQRRVFLGTTAAAAMGAAVPPCQAAATVSTAGPALPRKVHVLVDARQAESVAYARQAARTASALHELPQRVDLQWARALFAQVRSEGAALLGATRASDHFVLRQLAFDLGFMATAETHVPGAGVPLVQWTLSPRHTDNQQALTPA